MLYVTLIHPKISVQIMLWRLRILCFYSVICTFTLAFFIIFCLPLTIIKVKYSTKYRLAKFFSEVFITSAEFICGLKYDVEGMDMLPRQASIAIGNHQSFWDNFIVQIIIPEHSWIIKRQLFKMPLFGWALKMAEPIAVDRTASLSVKQILREGQKKLEKGQWLIIFPESTRLLPGQTAKFKPSATKLAQISKVPIVLFVHNAGVFWPKGFWIKKPGTIKIKFLEVIYPEQAASYDVRGLTEHIEQLINNGKQVLHENEIT